MIGEIAQPALFFGILFIAGPFLGHYMARVYKGERTWLTRLGSPLERGIYRLLGTNSDVEQDWKSYTVSLLLVNTLGLIFLYGLLCLQGVLPLNPQHFPGMPWHLAFNTAVSFVTNTNWQAYGGESTLSYLSQMVGLTAQNFLSAATGMAVAVALARGLARRSSGRIGNFYVDMTRSVVYILLPLAFIVALVLLSQGVIDNFAHYQHVTTLAGAHQTIPGGPAASQIAIKQIGTNGGGFFNTNSAYPFENPTPLSNFIELLSILLIPVALVFTFGRLVGDRRQGRALFVAMAIMLVAGWLVIQHAEKAGNAEFANLPVATKPGNMEGKEVRFGITDSTLWAEATTAASNGSVNSMLDSYTPIGGLVPLANIMTGEVVFGGVGAGLYGMIVYVVLAVFLAGLMVGRTPEYLGKKIEAREVTFALLAFLTLPVLILGFGEFSAVLPAGLASLGNHGPHGLSEILYAYASATGNNGSAFAGFNAGTPFQDTMLGLAMFFGRFVVIIPMLALAGSMARKTAVAESTGSFPTHGPLFVILLLVVILVLGGLTFFPALALGPIAEHLSMLKHLVY